jgi:uncharacterized membrane protein YfcA
LNGHKAHRNREFQPKSQQSQHETRAAHLGREGRRGDHGIILEPDHPTVTSNARSVVFAPPFCSEMAAGMFQSPVFRIWFGSALIAWLIAFSTFDSIGFWLGHWYYAAMMVAGAFVAGFTPEGGGAVAFPVLNVFLHVDRVMARDFSMMIQSVGMTSASIFILTSRETIRRDYWPLVVFIPACFIGFLIGMAFFQSLHVYIIQALFLSLSATFVVSYYFSDHRGTRNELVINSTRDWVYLGTMLVIGGIVSSLFGTGGDIIVYTLLVTRFNMTAKIATRMSIVLQASISILGYLYRIVIDHGLTEYQFKTWLCAAPIVLFMAPLGAYILSRLHVNWMLRAIIVINIFQLFYFNAVDPSINKIIASACFTALLGAIFFFALRHISFRNKAAAVTVQGGQPRYAQNRTLV